MFKTMSVKGLSLVVITTALLWSSSTADAKVLSYMVDDFEDGEFVESPYWWEFGNLELTIKDNNLAESSFVGSRSLRLRGQSKNWYIGGTGVVLDMDGTWFNGIKMIVRGHGQEKSGNITIELFDDDNENYKLETNPNHPGKLTFDDKWVYTFKVDWEGWKVVIIPMKKFRDDNPTVGDNIWNPSKENGSGGLIQMQMIAIAPQKKSKMDIQIDSIKLFKDKKLSPYL